MGLPFTYVVRSVQSAVILCAAFIASHKINNWLLKDNTTFKDKSALYGRDLQEGEAPSW